MRRIILPKAGHVAAIVFAAIFMIMLLSCESRFGKPQDDLSLVINKGFDKKGIASSLWVSSIKNLRRENFNPQDMSVNKPLTEEESDWYALLLGKTTLWLGMVDSLSVPFGNISPPDTITLLLGNNSGEDAFIYADSMICFDLGRMYSNYGSALKPANKSRIDRIFAHELTHVLHKAWRRKNSIVIDSPLDRALWICLSEGIGNYRSLSAKWFTEENKSSPYAKEKLNKLQAVFVERMAALENASEEEAEVLMKGISMGPFNRKWGALTVALWLSQEVKGNERNLQKWINAGPGGVTELAKKYLPDELKGKLPGIDRY